MRNASNPEPLLEVRGLTAGFGAGPVLFGIDLEVGHAELVALVGANGAGKSTLLGALSGLIRATSGTITRAGEGGPSAIPESLVREAVAHARQRRPCVGEVCLERER